MIFPYSKNRKIGLLGGSFNPAHSAHIYLSLYALKALKLDEVWWLVSPQNPLKNKSETAPYEVRFSFAKNLAKPHVRIRVLDIEQRCKSYYTHQTLRLMKRRFPGVHFVWMMGADNLAQFHRWQQWERIGMQVPLAVFDRAPQSYPARNSRAYSRFSKFLLKNIGINSLKAAPALTFLAMPRQSLSSTQLRKMLGEDAFLGHNKIAGH